MSHPCDDDDCRDYWEFVQTVMAEQYAEVLRKMEQENKDSPSRDDHGDKEEEK